MQSETETFWDILKQSLVDGTFRTLKLTRPQAKTDETPRRQSVRPILLKGQPAYQWELQFEKKQHHLNLSSAETCSRTEKLLGTDYLEAFLDTSGSAVHAKVRNGRLSLRLTRQPSPATETLLPAHDREKRYLIPSGIPCPFLIALDVMTPEGRVKAKKEKKFRQINRYLEMVDDVYPSLPATGTLRIIDFGCGLSYLTFAVRHLLAEIHGRTVELVGIDRNPEVVQRCRDISQRLSLSGASFVSGTIEEIRREGAVDLAISLHACDTATDSALEFAVAQRAKVILAAPCCQHELSPLIHAPHLEGILRHGILRERFAALATDALRVCALDAAGYRTQILEFIDLEHTPKNLLIRAVRSDRGIGGSDQGPARYAALKAELGLAETSVDRILRAAEENHPRE